MDKNNTNNAIDTMIKHPFATAVLIACAANAIANIIATVKGVNPTPIVSVVSKNK